jgi:ATP-binding protein involved in chromosome partitioning
MKGKIEADVKAAMNSVAGLKSFSFEFGAQVRPAALGQSQDLLPGVKNVVLVGAGKGGVGKSTVALNLAASLAQFGARVGLLDADFYGPSVPVMTGITKKPISKDGKTLELYFSDATKLTRAGQVVSFDTLKNGQKLEVQLEKDGSRLKPLAVAILD